MTLVSVAVQCDSPDCVPVQMRAVQTSAHLSAHPMLVADGSLLSTSAWSITHIGTGMLIASFEDWDAEQSHAPDLSALRGLSAWLEQNMDLNSNDIELIAERLSRIDGDVLNVIGVYRTSINDWREPLHCGCGAANAHPLLNTCYRCRINARPELRLVSADK